jgi:cell division protein FtsA
MRKSDIIAGLDMGSGRVTCILAEYNAETNKTRILSGSSVPCRGLKGGVVINISETSRAVSYAMEEAEEKADVIVREVYLGIRGSHIQSTNGRGAYSIARTDKEINAEDVTNVIENAKATSISSDREILHVLPQEFSLDRQKGVPNPIGMEGSLLEVGVHIVTASTSHLNNLMKAVSQSGFSVIEPIYSLLALGEIVVTPEEKDLGCLLIDVGGQNTSIGVYYDGSLRFSKEIPLGGDYITRDIAYALRTSMNTAQDIKEKHGAVLSSMIDGTKTISVAGLDGRSTKEIEPRNLLDYIQPRVEEIYDKINLALQNSDYADLPGGAVLTGGSSKLKGMAEAAEQLLDLKQSRLGVVRVEFVELDDEYLNPVYTTATGLVCYPHLRPWVSEHVLSRRGVVLKRRVLSWFRDIF